MGRHEIRLRRQRMTSRRIDHHKNFSDLLQEHQKTNRTKRLIKLFLLLFFFVCIMSFFYYMYKHMEKDKSDERQTAYTEEVITDKGFDGTS